jgi:hypothetical protein
MSSAHVFCTDLARERGEPHEGTGAVDNRFLLFRWPRGKWRVPRSASAGLPRAIAEAMAHAEREGGWVILVDGHDTDIPAIMSFPEAVRVDGGEADLAAALHAWAEGATLAGEPLVRRVILSCVDSRTDACCARTGFPTYKALAENADASEFLVLQSCHLGGCRFASSVMLPDGCERYGRITAEDVPDFLAAVGHGEIYLPKYKGRSNLDEPSQVAELAARRWAAKTGRDAATVALSAGDDGGNIRFYEAEVAGARLSISLEARDFIMHGGCDGIGEPGTLTRRWLVREVVASSRIPAE